MFRLKHIDIDIGQLICSKIVYLENLWIEFNELSTYLNWNFAPWNLSKDRIECGIH